MEAQFPGKFLWAIAGPLVLSLRKGGYQQIPKPCLNPMDDQLVGVSRSRPGQRTEPRPKRCHRPAEPSVCLLDGA